MCFLFSVSDRAQTTTENGLDSTLPVVVSQPRARYNVGPKHLAPTTTSDDQSDLSRPTSVFGVAPSHDTLKVFGVGLSRTGTSSLAGNSLLLLFSVRFVAFVVFC